MDPEGNSASVTSNMTSTPNFPHFSLLMDSNEDDFQYNESHPDLGNLSPSGQAEVVGFENPSFSMNSSMQLQELGFGIPNTALANKIVHYSFGIVLSLIGLAGATGNLLVLYVFTRYRRLRGGGVPLILSLAAGDFSMSILHIMPAYSSFRETWSFGELGCEIYAASVGLCGLASLLTLSVIAAERFSVIMGSPATFLSSKKACALIWVFSLGLVFPPFVGWSKYVHEGMSTSCSWDYMSRNWRNRLYYIFLLTFGFIVPVSIIIISYLGILHVVCKQSSQMDGIRRNGGMSKRSPTRSELRTAQVVLSIITCYLISWTPYAVCTMIGQFGDASLLSPLSTALPAIFAKASVIYNPFVYGLSHPLFRTAIATLKAQYLRKETPSRIPLNPHQYGRRYHYHKKGDGGGSSSNNNRKTQLVVMARGNGTTTSTFDSPRRPLDGQKIIQFDGFRGRIPQHLLRHFTGASAANTSPGKNNLLTQHSTATTPKFKDVTVERANISSTSSPSTSFRTQRNHKKQTRYRKKGVWIFKQPLGPTSDSDATGRTTAAVTGNGSSVGDGEYLGESLDIETHPSPFFPARESDKRKIINARKGEEELSIKNSHTFFLCKRRQEIIEKTFFQSENCLIHDLRMMEEDNKRKDLERDGLEWKERKRLEKKEEQEKIRELHKSFMTASNDKLLHEFYSYENDQLPEKLEGTTLLPAHIGKDKHKNERIKRDLDADGYLPLIPLGDGSQDIDTSTKLKLNNIRSSGKRFSWAGSRSNEDSDPQLKTRNLASSAFMYPSGSSKVGQHISILSRIRRKSIVAEKQRKMKTTFGSISLLKSCLSMGDMKKVGGSVTQPKDTTSEQKASSFQNRMPKSISLYGGLKLPVRNATVVPGCGKSYEDCCCCNDEVTTFPYTCSRDIFQLIPEVSRPPPSPERNLRGFSRKRNPLSSSSPEIYMSESRSRKNNYNAIVIEQFGNIHELSLLVDYDEVDIASSRCSESCYESCRSDLCSPSLEGEDLFWDEDNV